MTTLVEFLQDRLAEDEHDARRVLIVAQHASLMLADPKRLGTEQVGWYSWRDVEALAYRALSDVEAKRTLLAIHEGLLRAEAQLHDAGDYLGEAIARAGLKVSDGTLQVLAQRYGDHPDYERAWAPDDYAAPA